MSKIKNCSITKLTAKEAKIAETTVGSLQDHLTASDVRQPESQCHRQKTIVHKVASSSRPDSLAECDG
jgi:hypothetical protein